MYADIHIKDNLDNTMKDKEQLLTEATEILKGTGWHPVRAQIIGLFYTSNQKYFTFQEIIDTLKISKSTASRALNFLLDLGKIDYITKGQNKRKRYFYMSVKGNIDLIDKWLESLKRQQHFFEKILPLRDNTNEELNHLIQHQISVFKEVIPFFKDQNKKNFK